MTNHPIQQLLETSFKAFSEQNFRDAAHGLEKAIAIDSRCLPAIQLLALIKASENNFFEAQKLLKKAISINPDDPSLHFNLAKALSDGNKDAESIPHHQKAIQLAPQNIDAKLNYSKSLMQCGRSREALEIIKDCIKTQPNRADLWVNKGALLNNLENYEEAINCFDKAINLDPLSAESFYNKGISYSKQSAHNSAIENFEKAIQINNKYCQALTNLGIELGKLKRYEEALNALNIALLIKPDHVESLINKSFILYSTHQHVKSLEVLDLALHIQPNNINCLSNKALSLAMIGNPQEALQFINKALRIDPNNLQALLNKSNIHTKLKEIPNAIASMEALVKISRDFRIALSNLLYLKMQICAWDDYEQSKKELLKKVDTGEAIALPLMLLALTDSEELHKKCAEKYVLELHPKNNSLGEVQGRKKNNSSERIKIGYFSADFHNHPMARLMANVYECHDRNKFELIAFSFGPSEENTMRLKIIKTFDHFYDVRHKSDKEIAIFARELNIDIAVDLNGFTDNARTDIFSYGAAPIQLNYLGYPGTMGAEYIHYIIADKHLIPDVATNNYLENVLYLPGCYQPNDHAIQFSDIAPTREECGLPKNGFVFCCFNNNYKINPATFDAWMKILDSVEGSVLWLLEDNVHAKENLIKEAELRKVDANRLVFAKRVSLEEHLDRHRHADLFLDTFPYNAHTTASDALRAGLPILTHSGNSFASKVASSLLSAINMPELITHSWEKYVSTAIELALSPEKIAKVKSKLSKEHSQNNLFNLEIFTKNLEDIYSQLMQ